MQAADGHPVHPAALAADDRPREACGVFGIWAPALDVARETFYGVHVLQHRGQESAGICASDGQRLKLKTGMGLVSQVFDEEALAPLGGIAAIGHTRYSTTGASRFRNAQPILLEDPADGSEIAVAHNGNVVNPAQVRLELADQGHEFATSTDTEVLAKFLLSQTGSWAARFGAMMRRIPAAYSLVLLRPDRLMAARDPHGVRPLCVGRIDGGAGDGPGYVVASETCALDQLGARLIRDVQPGELVSITAEGIEFEQAVEPSGSGGCIFEHIYFARPDSFLDGHLAWQTRFRMGEVLAREVPADADIVIGVPDSATPHAHGYAEGSGIPYVDGLVKNRYVGRTFISPDQRLRDLGARLKWNPLRPVLEGKRVAVIDDSIVRGTTTPRIVQLLRSAGAREVHMRIAAPPIRHPCHLGVDMARQGELIAAAHAPEDVNAAVGGTIGADSLGYLSLAGLREAVDLGKPTCVGCFTGEYPVPIQTEMLELAEDGERAACASPEAAEAGLAVAD